MFVGDFNIDLVSQSPLSQDILSTKLIFSFHLHQVVTEPTRLTSSLIDHVYISNPSLVNLCSTIPAISNSDHPSITTILSRCTVPPQKIHHKMWFYKVANLVQANELLLKSLPDDRPTERGVNEAWSWKSQSCLLCYAMSSYIPRVIRVQR